MRIDGLRTVGWLLSRMTPRLRRGVALLSLFVWSYQAAAAGTGMSRIDPASFRCEDFLSHAGADQAWQDMIEVEHCDRIKRLARLTDSGAEPEFFVEWIPQARLPAAFRASVPLLRVVFPQRIFFDTAESRLRPEAIAVVRTVAESLRNDVPDVTLFVAGHTDPRGSRDYNQNLSVDRANAVATEILGQGVNLATVWRIGFGSDMPAVPNDGPLGWGYNRRVEFLFAARPEAIAIWLADMQLDGLCSGTSSRQTNACRRSLALRSDYEAIEVVTRKSVASPQSKDKKIDVSAAPRIAIDPKPGRRIVINPVNRTAIQKNSEEKS